MAKLIIGDKAPEFILKNTQDEPIALSDYLGKKLLLVFTRGFA